MAKKTLISGPILACLAQIWARKWLLPLLVFRDCPKLSSHTQFPGKLMNQT